MRDGSRFIAEIPADSVTEGLAYYVEAYDDQGNGPTRRGTPEEPLVPRLVEGPPAWAVAAEEAPSVDGSDTQRFWGRVGLASGATLLAGGLVAGAVRLFASDFETRTSATTPANVLLISGTVFVTGGGVLLVTLPSEP